jgi:tRNA pseudouridine32 synthase / 23S rRNA pseudouridine746 synthase
MVSRAFLPRIDPAPASLLHYLIERFAHIDAEIWRERLRSGKVTFADGTPIDESTPYRAESFVLYSREVVAEQKNEAREKILYRDENILVADKPHGLPVVPSGAVVRECLLRRVMEATGLTDIVPVHRLDRETAGVVMFAVRPEIRGVYHSLFSEKKIEREYIAVARVDDPPVEREWNVRNRLAAAEPWFRMQIVDGEPNAETRIRLLELRNGRGLFALRPLSGKKHQLRIHMVSIGYRIENDPFYPELLAEYEKLAAPLQLLANRLAFVDPITGAEMEFRSEVKLDFRADSSE